MAARELQIARMTLLRWLKNKDIREKFGIKAVKDPLNGHIFISQGSVTKLANRYELVSPPVPVEQGMK